MKYVLQGLNCANCAGKIENQINEIPELIDVKINLATMSLHLEPSFADAVQEIVDRVEPGVRLIPIENNTIKVELADVHYVKNNLIRIVISAVLLGGALLAERNANPDAYTPYIFYAGAYLIAGYPVLSRAINNIIKGQIFDENFLMSIATLGAIAVNALGEAVSVMLFYAVGQMFQDLAVNRSRRSISDLMNLRPDYANLLLNGRSERVDPTGIAIGQIIEVKPGERVPLDGTIIEGSSYIDSSALTGESKPRRVEAGTAILSGVINESGLLRIRVDKEYAQSSVSKILELVENAAGRKAPAELFISRFAGWYTQLVVAGALITAFLPPLIIPGAELNAWVYRALILLVISCPCALVVSIPLGYFGGIGAASRAGILVKGANVLDGIVNVHTVVFDKTGTLTRGVFEVIEIKSYNGFSEQKVLEWAARAEIHSNHPIARSIREAWPGQLDPALVGQYEEIKGWGIRALVDGQPVLIGSRRLLVREGIEVFNNHKEGNRVHLAVNGEYAGSLLISDEIKKDAAEAIQQLKQLGVKQIIMLSGDDRNTSEIVAGELGVDQVYAELLPQDKVEKMEAIKELIPSRQGRLVFVGDGINDAPVLARADIGAAMGAMGSDAAIEAADVVLMDDRLGKLPRAIKIARFTRKIIIQNIVLALGIKAAVVILGLLGIATMWEAVFADVGAALLAVLNSARALRAGSLFQA
ncbi:lead, cadmium, zinc and mercury transporting atpase [hydrocarbon metagenome]|uniref:Lead, cadmium, zinc and mercury transporting atpase n=1 Tax=hydrocarbon metagenome TaxID=938273 RepID=A0A0W8E1B8_9ZZZZ